jgi:glutathione S-transferase
MLQLDLSEYSAISDYIKRLGERAAFQKTIGGRS